MQIKLLNFIISITFVIYPFPQLFQILITYKIDSSRLYNIERIGQKQPIGPKQVHNLPVTDSPQ